MGDGDGCWGFAVLLGAVWLRDVPLFPPALWWAVLCGSSAAGTGGRCGSQQGGRLVDATETSLGRAAPVSGSPELEEHGGTQVPLRGDESK